MTSAPESLPNRVLVLLPVGRDAQLACSILEREHLPSFACSGLDELLSQLIAGAGTAIIGDEAFDHNVERLSVWVKDQPAWSDFPFVILTGGRKTSRLPCGRLEVGQFLAQALGNVTLLERPLRAVSLLSIVRAALRARSRQYEVEHYIRQTGRAEAERVEAYAREQAAHAQVEVLNHVGEILSAESNLDLLLSAVVEAGTDLSSADVGVFFSEDAAGKPGFFIPRCVSGITLEAATDLLGPYARVEGGALADKRVVRCSPFDSESGSGQRWVRAIAEKLRLTHCVVVPVASPRGATVGILLLGRLGDGPFSARDERVAASLASQAAIAIDNARLFITVEKERTRLEAARQVLQRSNEELRQFAYVASHDLQEPLRTVAAFTQLLVGRYRGHADPGADECVSFIVDGVQRISLLIHDLLEYSHAGVSNVLPAHPASAEEALNQVLLSLSAAIQESGAVITHEPLPNIWIESRSLILVFQNLIGNAIKYRGPDRPRVHVYATTVGDDQIFSVEDHGIGIAPQYHERIFGIFKRLHGKEIPGTGIGLAICQRIVEGLGGKIWVESEPGKGSTFRFTLPKEPRGMQRDMAEFATLGAIATPSTSP